MDMYSMIVSSQAEIRRRLIANGYSEGQCNDAFKAFNTIDRMAADIAREKGVTINYGEMI